MTYTRSLLNLIIFLQIFIMKIKLCYKSATYSIAPLRTFQKYTCHPNI